MVARPWEFDSPLRHHKKIDGLAGAAAFANPFDFCASLFLPHVSPTALEHRVFITLPRVPPLPAMGSPLCPAMWGKRGGGVGEIVFLLWFASHNAAAKSVARSGHSCSSCVVAVSFAVASFRGHSPLLPSCLSPSRFSPSPSTPLPRFHPKLPGAAGPSWPQTPPRVRASRVFFAMSGIWSRKNGIRWCGNRTSNSRGRAS